MPENTNNQLHTPASGATHYSGPALEWLRALPEDRSKADLVGLDSGFAIRCIHELSENKTFDLPLSVEHAGSEYLLHFYFEARNREKVFGTKNLYVGYPFLLARLGGYEVAAPLFLWQLALEPHAQHTEQWVAQRNDLHHLSPNYPLFHLIDALYGTDLSSRSRDLVENRKMNGRSLAEITEQVRSTLGLQEDGLPLSVQPLPTPAERHEAFDEGRIQWSAVAGIFPTLPRTVVTQPPVVAPDLPADAELWGHTFSLLPLDPSQRSVLNNVQRNALTVVEGASGTGKTYLISALAINALSNGKKCLVVSKSIHSLRRAQKFLLEKGFGDVSFILRDTAGDKLMLADMLRMASDNKLKASFEEEKYKSLLNKTLREQRKLDDAWTEIHAPFFGELSFSETVGQFLRANRTEGKELLLSQLNPSDFGFNREEYEGIKKALRESEPLFLRFPTLNHPLSRLSHEVFLRYSSPDGLYWTQQAVRQLLDQATGLHHNYISKSNDYAEALLDHYEQYYFHLSGFIKKIRNALEDGVTRFGADFEKPVSATEKLYGVFSERYKEIIAAKENIGVNFEEMRKTYSFRKYFDFDFPPHFDPRNIKKISELTRDFDAAMQLWRRRIPAIVREDVRRLNAKSIHPDLEFKESIRDLETAMDQFLETFNDSGLYQDPLRHEMLTIPKRQEFLEELIGRLEDTRFYLRDFEDFYIWQKHWLQLKPAEQRVVRALCKIKPTNWQAAFESWYLHHLLQNGFNPGIVWDNSTLDDLNNSARELRLMMPLSIGTHWHNRKNKALKALRSADGNAFKTWFGKNNRSLSADRKPDELFRNHIEALTETLPVLLVTPEVALDVVQASNMVFDVVLVDEAHNISKQECYHLFDMAKNLVVFGDSKQDMTPFAQDDLLEFCKGIGARTLSLEYQHSDGPQEWVRFNKIAFGTPYKRLPSERSARDATVVEQVSGRYDESTGTNDAEARQIIDWLNLIEPTPAKTYPVVGIACATVQQRDLIAAQLLRIRQKKLAGHEKIQQLHLNGMGVYQFAELQGQHVDVLLLSLTHGATDAHGTLSRHLHFWNNQLGINQLYIALTRASQKIFIAHSIPSGLYSVLAADKNFFGTCILSHLVSFAEHIQRGDLHASEEQLRKMKELLEYRHTEFPVTTFMEEVGYALSPYFEKSQLQWSGFAAGMRVPLVVEGKDDEEPSSVLLFDGVLSHTTMPSYEWEEKLKHYFQRNKIEFVPVLSANWWKSPKQEARRLASRMLRREE